MIAPKLALRNVSSGYEAGGKVLFDISLEIGSGEVVALMGRNGMGKTTLINTITGVIPLSSGTVHFLGKEVTSAPIHRRAAAGIGLVPEGRQIFPSLSVRENLVATSKLRAGKNSQWTLERVYDLFPRLKERATNMGNQLSGGEQQMLAIGRALMTNPELLILDEATEGLSPLVRQQIWKTIAALKETQLSILVIDKNVRSLAMVADRHLFMEKGRIVWSGSTSELIANPGLSDRYVGI
jgi:branched-chain amino acid transport system ATP-binding protein